MHTYLFQYRKDGQNSFCTGNDGVNDKGNICSAFSRQSIEVLDRLGTRQVVHSNVMDGCLRQKLQKGVGHAQSTSQNGNEGDSVGDFVSSANLHMLILRFLAVGDGYWNFTSFQIGCRFVAKVIGYFFQDLPELSRRRVGGTQNGNLLQ